MEKNKLTFNSEAHEYFLDGVRIPGVSEILTGAGLVDLSQIRPDVLESARKFGKAVHTACELWDKNDLNIDILSAPLIPYLEAWKKFIADYDVVLGVSEKIVYSAKWRFAGTLDRLGFANNKLTLIDIKSGSTIQPATALQTAGYKIAYEEMTKLKIKQRWIVQLNEDGYKITECKEQSDESVFIGTMQVYQWLKKHNLLKGDEKNGKLN